MPPEEMSVPTAGLTWEAAHTVSGTEPTMEEQLVSDAGGSAPLEEVATITVGASETWTLGACPYAALPVSVTTQSGVDTFTEHMRYLPDLGTAVLVAFAQDDETVTYDYVDTRVE